jgi:cell division protein FtsW
VRRSLPSTAGPWETRLFGIVTVVLVAFGVVAIYSASSVLYGSSFAVRQLIGAGLGIVAMLIATRIDYHAWRDSAWLLLGAAVLMLLILLLPFMDFMTQTVKGATRWLQLLAAKKDTAVRDLKRGLLPFMVIIVPVSCLVLLEPDLSTACLLILLAGIVLFTAGAKIGHFLLIGLAASPFVGGSMAKAAYQVQRMTSFLSPGEDLQNGNWQIQQSLTGFGAGRLFGVGFGKGSQKLGYLPEAHSDFIYSTIGEEWGFIGAAATVLFYWLLITLGLRVARTAPDRFGMLLATGITALIGVTALTHIAVNLALLPSTGLPLPFLSDGRSNLVISLFATGVLINIGNSRFRPAKHR